MASFTTRIELHDAVSSDYITLHEQMKKENFTQTIISDDGIEYELPTAEYNCIGTLTRNQVMASAKRAAEVTKKTYSILITESNGRSWHNLNKTKKQ